MSSGSMYGRALSMLRQVVTTLDDQLVSVDLYALRRDTIGNLTSTQLTGAAAAMAPPMASSTADTWRDVLAAVSPPLVEFARELQRLQEYTDRQSRSVLSMQRVIWALEGMTAMMAYVTLSSLLTRSQYEKDVGGTAVSVGTIVAVTLLMLGVFGAWNASVNEMYRKVKFQASSPIKAVLTTYAKSLSGKMIVIAMAAVVTGRDVRDELSSFQSSSQTFNSAWASRTASCGKKRKQATSLGPNNCAMAGIDPCDTSSQFTLASMAGVIQKYCAYLLVDIADALIDLKENGVDRYDEAALWRAVYVGVEAVRKLVLVEYDAGGPDAEAVITTAAARRAVETEIAPILCLHAVELRDMIAPVESVILNAPGDDAHGTIKVGAETFGGGLRLLNGDGRGGASPMTQAQCSRSCMASPMTCGFSYYDVKNEMCYVATDPRSVSAGFQLVSEAPADKKPTISGVATITARQPSGTARQPSGTGAGAGTPANTFVALAGSTDPAALYAYAIAQRGAVAATVANQSTDLAERIAAVLKRYRYRVDLAATRAFLDAKLSAFYGATLYGAGDGGPGSVSAAVDGVLARVARLVAERRRLRQPRNIDADRLIRKVAELSADDADELMQALTDASDAAKGHRDLYPPYAEAAPQTIATIVSVLGGLVFLSCYAVFVVIVWDMYANHGSIKLEALIQRLIAGTCVFVIVTVVTETMTYKHAYRLQHNKQVSLDNGGTLVTSASNTVSQVERLIALINKPSPGTSAARLAQEQHGASSAALNGCVQMMQAYDACNSITSGQAAMPVPVAEIVLYGIVAAVFVGIAAFVVYRVAPVEKVGNIRSLTRLRHRLERGDHGAFVEAQQVVECSKPPVHVWAMFTWFAVLLFAALTGWFGLASQDVVADYRASLDVQRDCVSP